MALLHRSPMDASTLNEGAPSNRSTGNSLGFLGSAFQGNEIPSSWPIAVAIGCSCRMLETSKRRP